MFRVLQVASFAGRIAALEEIHCILTNAANTGAITALPGGNGTQHNAGIQLDVVIGWCREEELVDVLFRDNLHHPAFVER